MTNDLILVPKVPLGTQVYEALLRRRLEGIQEAELLNVRSQAELRTEALIASCRASVNGYSAA